MHEKWRALLTDERPFRQRALLAALVALFFSATVFLFGPYEYQLSNYQEFWFSFSAVWWCFALLFLVSLCILTAPGLLLTGKLFNLYISALFAVALALYIQGNFINVDYGLLTGDEVRWERYGAYSFSNTALWIGLIVVPFIVLYFSGKVWFNAVRLVSAGIVLVQLTTLVTLVVANPDCVHNSAKGLGFSWSGTQELSATENTLVILLDECDVTYINEQRMYDEHSTDFLTGFTFYPDTVGVYNMTYPAVTQYFTGEMWYMDTSVETYNATAWESDELLRGMKERGFDVRILGYQKDFVTPHTELIDNAAIEDPKIRSYAGLTRTMMQLVAFRYLPHGLKAGVWTPTGDLDAFLAPGEVYHINDATFYEKLLAHPLTASREEPVFRYLHLDGMHVPYRLDENVQYVSGDEATSYKQGRAVLRILETIISQLKEAGIYDNSAIIIVADHGKKEDRFTEITQPHNPTLMVKPRNADGPFTISYQPMWTTNMKATMMDAAGLPGYADFGYSLLRPEECPEVVRYFYPIVTADAQNELVEYEVTGEATYMNVWRKTGRTWHLGKEYFND